MKRGAAFGAACEVQAERMGLGGPELTVDVSSKLIVRMIHGAPSPSLAISSFFRWARARRMRVPTVIFEIPSRLAIAI